MQAPTSLLLGCKWQLLLCRGGGDPPRRAEGHNGQEAGLFTWCPTTPEKATGHRAMEEECGQDVEWPGSSRGLGARGPRPYSGQPVPSPSTDEGSPCWRLIMLCGSAGRGPPS